MAAGQRFERAKLLRNLNKRQPNHKCVKTPVRCANPGAAAYDDIRPGPETRPKQYGRPVGPR